MEKPFALPRELKSCLWAALSMLALYLLPMGALAVGWIARDFKTGALAALVTFVTLVSVVASSLILIREPSALTASLPLISGVLYAVLPDAILGTIDDGVAFTFGALLSYLLWRKRSARLPAWLLLPLFAAGAYTTLGGFVLPFLGPLDELIAYLVIGGLTWYYLKQPAVVNQQAAVNQPAAVESGPPAPAQAEPTRQPAELPINPQTAAVEENQVNSPGMPIETGQDTGTVEESQV